MSRYVLVPLALLEPGPVRKPRRGRVVVVAEIPRTSPTRYAVLAGHDEYWQAVRDGAEAVFVEVVLAPQTASEGSPSSR